jgi:hypothetical protein
MTKKENVKLKSVVVMTILVLLASMFAIMSKAFLPSDVNIDDFNSVFVTILGFPIVASLYFIMVYSHSAIVTKIFGERTNLSKIQIGLRFGVCFALIFLFGMQEVVVEASPFSSWGIDFVVYQFFMGLGEALVALIMCLAISKWTLKDKKLVDHPGDYSIKNKTLLLIFIVVAFTLGRAMVYEIGLIASNVDNFPIATYGWTILFGLIIAFCFILLYPIFGEEKNSFKLSSKIVLMTIGLSWIIFNMFIGLIFKGAMVDVLLRSGLDVFWVFVASYFWHKYFNGSNHPTSDLQ